MKVALISDTQWKTWKKNHDFAKHIRRAFALFYEECRKRMVDLIVHGGDFYEYKSYMTAGCLQDSGAEVHEGSTIAKTRIVVGNHDTIYKDHSVNLLSNFNNYRNVEVLSDYKYEDYDGVRIHYIPYFEESRVIQIIQAAKIKKNVRNYLIGHFGVNGFSYQEDGYTDPQASIKPQYFGVFDHVFLGHFHHFQSKGNITYISSPFQFRHGDERGKHGFIFLDTDTGEWEFVENPHSPRFMTVELTEDNLMEVAGIKDHFLRVVLRHHVSNTILEEVGKTLKENNYDFYWDFQMEAEDGAVPTIQGWDEVVSSDPDEIIRNGAANVPGLPWKSGELVDFLLNEEV